MKGNEYSDLIASYLVTNFAERGLQVYREIQLGKSIIGKNRRVDILAVSTEANDAYAIECKYQGVQGTTDEKVPYTLQDMISLPMSGAVAYAGEGFSTGVLHMLEASEIAAYCLPEEDLARTSATRELDHLLAMHFRWWDVLVGKKKPFEAR